MSKTTLALKSTVTRRAPLPTAELVDADERAKQSEHNRAAAQAANEALQASKQSRKYPKPRADPNALQSAFLAGNLGQPVSVFLSNGIRVTGKIRQFDQFTILLQAPGGMDQRIFKHAVASLQPSSR